MYKHINIKLIHMDLDTGRKLGYAEENHTVTRRICKHCTEWAPTVLNTTPFLGGRNSQYYFYTIWLIGVSFQCLKCHSHFLVPSSAFFLAFYMYWIIAVWLAFL